MAKRKFTFGLTIKEFQIRLRQLNMPSSRSAISHWEEKGLINFRKNYRGWAVFESKKEIDKVILSFQRKVTYVAPGTITPIKFGNKGVHLNIKEAQE